MVSLKGVLSELLFCLLIDELTGAAAGAVLSTGPGLHRSPGRGRLPCRTPGGVCRGYGKADGHRFSRAVSSSVYVTEYSSLLAVIAETGAAALIFLAVLSLHQEPQIIPGHACRNEGEYIQASLKEIFEGESYWAHISELSCTFEQVSSTADKPRRTEPAKLNQITEKCAAGAPLHTCWERELYKTYQGMVDLLALVETYGKSTGQFFLELKRRCPVPRNGL